MNDRESGQAWMELWRTQREFRPAHPHDPPSVFLDYDITLGWTLVYPDQRRVPMPDEIATAAVHGRAMEVLRRTLDGRRRLEAAMLADNIDAALLRACQRAGQPA